MSSQPSHMPVNFKKLDASAREPIYGSAHASGADLCALADVLVPAHGRAKIPHGLAFETPVGWELQLRPRSGLGLKAGVFALLGTIDGDYRGEVNTVLVNTTPEDYQVKAGDRVSQLVLAPVTRARFAEQAELGTTDRGTGGFGSTGR